MTADARLARAAEAVAAHGIASAAVTVEGHEGEIAAVRVPAGEWEALAAAGAELSRAVRAAGFRYVALDLAPAAE